MLSHRRLLAGTVLLLGLLPVTGCGTRQPDSQPRATATVTATTTVTEAASSSAEPSTSPTSTGPAERCRTGTLHFRLLPGEGAAGSTYYTLRMTNVSTTAPCRTRGFGGVSLVAGPHGQPIGAPADRAQRGTTRVVVLQPGQHADATLREVDAENYSSAKCRPRRATGLRIYPPDETRSTFVAHATTACRSADAHLLTLTPYASTR